jgi:hypothetical protein
MGQHSFKGVDNIQHSYFNLKVSDGDDRHVIPHCNIILGHF